MIYSLRVRGMLEPEESDLHDPSYFPRKWEPLATSCSMSNEVFGLRFHGSWTPVEVLPTNHASSSLLFTCPAFAI